VVQLVCNFKEKHIFETVKVGERGQIVIPKDIRDFFSIKPGNSLILVADEVRGIGLFKAEQMRTIAAYILEGVNRAEAAARDNDKRNRVQKR